MNYIRSFLFAPGSNPHVMQKALGCDVDAVILDLEDAVSISEKEMARAQVADLLKLADWGQRVYVRINGWETPWGKDDLAAAVAAGVDGIMLPKSEKRSVVAEVAGRLPQNVDFIPLIETANGILNAYDIARCSERVSRLAFGAVDFTADIGVEYSKTGTALLYARSQLVIVSRAADLLPPVDTVYPDLVDIAGFESELRQVKELGMFGKLAIHPKQLDLIHRTFTPCQDEIMDAQDVVKVFEEAEENGIAAIEFKGRFIDYPVYRRAQRVVALSKKLM